MRQLIGLVGVARAGKDTVADFLHQYRQFCRRAFADPLKDTAATLFGLPLDAFYLGDREQPDPFWGISPREMLQKLGTESVRNVFGEDFWIRRMELSLPPGESVVITDVRFPNEVAAVRRWGGTIWGIRRPGVAPVSPHISERMAAEDLDAVCDRVLMNDGSLDDLRDAVSRALLS